MNHDLLNKYNLRLPRYTSYPTAPHFSAAVTPDLYRTWLETLDPETPVSLYLHVVYCAEMCWFCGCHTKITKRYTPIAEYLETLLQEIDLVANALPARFTAKHIHFGGGSPTILSAPDFTRLMQRLKNCFSFSPDAETAVELDPRTADEAYIQAMAAAGVNRASVGVQDFNHKVQETVNRIQPFELVASVFKWLRRHGIDRINMDLMYGLPYQTTTSILDTVDRAVSLGPQRISLFGYAHVPWMRKHQTLLPEDCLPGFRDRWEQYEAATERLHQYGYVSIGLDHFALANDTMAIAQTEKRLNRNFQGYTTDTAPVLLGMGASGIGSLPQGYVANEGEVHAWRRMISGGILPIRRGIAISDEDRMRRMVIERLMCDLEVDLGEIASSFGRGHDYFTPELNEMQELEKDNLVIRHGHMLRMTEEGRPLVRVAAARFDQYLKQGELKHSKAI